MLPILGINFTPRINGKTQQNKSSNLRLRSYQSDSVSFSGKTEVAQVIDKTMGDFLTTLFNGQKFEKVNNKFVSEEFHSIGHINRLAVAMDDFYSGNMGRLKAFNNGNMLEGFTKYAYNLSILKRLIFLGPEGQLATNASKSDIFSKFAVEVMPSQKIGSSYIADGMKNFLSKEFAKNNDVLKVKVGQDSFTIKNEHMFSDDLASPIHSIMVEKITR